MLDRDNHHGNEVFLIVTFIIFLMIGVLFWCLFSLVLPVPTP